MAASVLAPFDGKVLPMPTASRPRLHATVLHHFSCAVVTWAGCGHVHQLREQRAGGGGLEEAGDDNGEQRD